MGAKKLSVFEMLRSGGPLLKTADLSTMIDGTAPYLVNIFQDFLASLNEKERHTIDKVLPKRGGRRFYINLAGTPTKPIVIEITQPPNLGTMSENDVKKQGIMGIDVPLDSLLALAESKTLGNVLRMMGQFGRPRQILNVLRIIWMFAPLLRLGYGGLKGIYRKLAAQF